LGTIGLWQSGSTPSRNNSAFYGGDIPWLKTGDLNDGMIKHIPESITKLALQKTSVKLNPAGSILIAMYGATIGKMGILTFPATTNQACCACSEFSGVDPLYLFYFLLQHRNKFIDIGSGGAQPNISKEKIVNTTIPLPPLKEQHRIVTAIENSFAYLNEIVENLN
jgi:type I restriction enzyme S subunit